MLKEESVQAAIDSIAQAQKDAIGKVFDDGLASAPSGGGLSQADIDAAVLAAQEADKVSLEAVKAQDAQALLDAVALVQAQLDAKVAELEQLKVDKGLEDAVVDGLKNGSQAIQDALDALKKLIAG